MPTRTSYQPFGGVEKPQGPAAPEHEGDASFITDWVMPGYLGVPVRSEAGEERGFSAAEPQRRGASPGEPDTGGYRGAAYRV